MRRFLLFCVNLSVLCFVMFSGLASTVYSETNCSDRYLTLVNPVRDRELWHEKSLGPIKEQYSIIEKKDFPATWLLQYDVLLDKELVDEIKTFDKNQELGVFLEVSERLADSAEVAYSPHTPWFSPKVVFLSGYEQSERRRLIDELFNKFKEEFGYFPKSVGAWWIDSYSLNYMKEKYGVRAALIVADQKTTDNYGVWGQWWGVPYYPSKANILVPARDSSDKQDVVVIQWAQRDLLKAYGEGPIFSNYSLQANDYIRQRENTSYFENLIKDYLDCRNKVSQITVGLETGIESVGFIKEYGNQLELLNKISGLEPVSMGDFYKKFASNYPGIVESFVLGDPQEGWVMNTKQRSNKKLGDNIFYNKPAFRDYYLADKTDFLNRRLDKLEGNFKDNLSFPITLLAISITGIIGLIIGRFRIFLLSAVFAISAHFLIFRSFESYGWTVFYGPSLSYLFYWQTVLMPAVFWLFLFSEKYLLKVIKKFYLLWFIPLTFGMDFIISSLRYTKLDDFYYLGFLVSPLRVLGIAVGNTGMFLFDKRFSATEIGAVLKFDFKLVWENSLIYLVVNPLLHIILGVLIGIIMIRFKKTTKVFFIIFAIFFIFYLLWQINLDPLSAKLIE